MKNVPQAIQRRDDLQKLKYKGVYTNSRLIEKQVAKHIRIGYLSHMKYSSAADLSKIQQHIDVFYFTQQILDQDVTGKLVSDKKYDVLLNMSARTHLAHRFTLW